MMKLNRKKTMIAGMILMLAACQPSANKTGDASAKADTLDAIFPKGVAGPALNFTGNAWNFGLVENDSVFTSIVGNVYFEPGARTNWHTHPAGQILMITDGEGYHQIKGQPRETLRKGSVVKCPPNVLHWHGATAEKGMHQLYIVPNTEKGIVDWKEPVTDEVYKSPGI